MKEMLERVKENGAVFKIEGIKVEYDRRNKTSAPATFGPWKISGITDHRNSVSHSKMKSLDSITSAIAEIEDY